jgi:hypothetical protein
MPDRASAPDPANRHDTELKQNRRKLVAWA